MQLTPRKHLDEHMAQSIRRESERGGGISSGMTYLGQGDIGNNDGVHGAGSSTEGLALVTVRVVLILVHLTILRGGVPGHSTLADANVASLGSDGGGLAAEVPMERSPDRSVIVH